MIHKLLAGKGRMKKAVSLLLCLALLGSSVITSNVTAEAESGVTAVEAVELSGMEDAEAVGADDEAAGSESTEEGGTTEKEAVVTEEQISTASENGETPAEETAEEKTPTEDTAVAAEAQTIDSSKSTEETSSEEVTETPTEEVTETPTEVVSEEATESISEVTTEAESVSEGEISAEAEGNTLSLGSSVSATADDGISLTSVSGTKTVAVGSTTTLTTNVYSNSGTWSSSDTSVATVSGNGKTVTVTGVSAGTVTITYTYTNNKGETRTDSTTVTVTGSGSSSNTIAVYVFVSGFVQGSSPKEYFSDDMLELLNVNTLDNYGYFAAGVIYLDMSKFSSSSTTSRITTEEEWNYVISVIKDYLYTNYSETCPDNIIAQYAEQIIKDIGYTQGNGYSGLWLAGGHSNITNAGGEVNGQYWHLDIRFETVKITYIYGENGITAADSSVAYDGNTAGSKVFIKGATMDYTPTIEAPDGWKIVGYYTTSDFQEGTEWDAVNQPINEDTTVYIKIVPEDDVVINYVVAEGDGTVTNPSNSNESAQNGYEYFNPTTGSPVGSTAAAGTGYVFDGWYSDADCTDLVSSEAHYTPAEPSDGWQEDDVYTYYAKFVPTKTSVKVTKVWDDNGSSLRPDSISVKLYADDATTATVEETITGSGDTWEYTFTNLPEYNYSYEGGPATTKIIYKAVEDAVANYSSVVDIGDDGNITIKNTLSTAKLTIQKEIEGNAGITTKQFTFTVSYTNASGESDTATYNLADGESNSNNPLDVKLGTTVTITEESGAYVATATLNDSEITVTETSGNSSLTFEINEDSTVVVTNTYNVYPDTGVNLDSVPYIALLCGVVALGAVVLIRRRRRLL